MKTSHMTFLNGFSIEYENFKLAQIITFKAPNKQRIYRKEHNKRLSTTQFLKLIMDIENATNLNEMFVKVEFKGFKKGGFLK